MRFGSIKPLKGSTPLIIMYNKIKKSKIRIPSTFLSYGLVIPLKQNVTHNFNALLFIH